MRTNTMNKQNWLKTNLLEIDWNFEETKLIEKMLPVEDLEKKHMPHLQKVCQVHGVPVPYAGVATQSECSFRGHKFFFLNLYYIYNFFFIKTVKPIKSYLSQLYQTIIKVMVILH